MPDDREENGAPPLWVRATINLAGLRLGEVAEADPASEYVQGCLASGYLVPIGEPTRSR